MDRRDRARGALLGLACGDAVGTTLEFTRPGTFRPIDDMVGGGPFRLEAGQWTDDTSLALCLAESLVDTGGHDPADQLRRYSWWRNQGHLSSNGRCFDIGGSTANAISRFENEGTVIDDPIDQEQAANGSLMRLSPVAVRWSTDPDTAVEMAAASSRTTHPADRPVDACRVYAAMTAAAIEGASRDEVLDPARWSHLDPASEIAEVIAGSFRTKADDEIRGSGYVVAALEAALWAIDGADDFADAVLRAANLGNDADTTAAIAGQLAGALWGASGIPEAWLAKLSLNERIVSLADRLHEAATGDPPLTPWPHDNYFHAWWVVPGQFLAGEYPGALDSDKARRKLDLLLDAGVRTIVDLTTPEDRLAPYEDELDHLAEVRGLDLKRINQPIPDLGVVDASVFGKLNDLINDEVSAHRPVFVHCWGGVGRTATVIGCLLARTGERDPLARIAQLRAGTRKARRPAPETEEQIAVVGVFGDDG